MKTVPLVVFIYVLSVLSAGAFSGCTSTRHIEGIHQAGATGERRSTARKIGDVFGWLCVNTIETFAQSGMQF